MNPVTDPRKTRKKLPVLQNVVEGVTCFSIQEKYGVECQRSSCSNWMKGAETQNCVLIAAQKGPRTLQEIGGLFNLTRMRICQIEKAIYEKIRNVG
jgi:hypothetical protein